MADQPRSAHPPIRSFKASRGLAECGEAAHGQQGADVPESLERRAVGDGDDSAAREQRAEFLVRDALGLKALEERRGHQHDADPDISQTPC